MGKFKLKRGDLSDLPSSLEEGDHYLAIDQTPPILYVGPSGGGTPQPISGAVSYFKLRVHVGTATDLEFTDGPLSNNGTVSLSEYSTGTWRGTMTDPPSSIIKTVIIAWDQISVALVPVECEFNPNGTVQFIFNDIDDTPHDPTGIEEAYGFVSH